MSFDPEQFRRELRKEITQAALQAQEETRQALAAADKTKPSMGTVEKLNRAAAEYAARQGMSVAAAKLDVERYSSEEQIDAFAQANVEREENAKKAQMQADFDASPEGIQATAAQVRAAGEARLAYAEDVRLVLSEKVGTDLSSLSADEVLALQDELDAKAAEQRLANDFDANLEAAMKGSEQ